MRDERCNVLAPPEAEEVLAEAEAAVAGAAGAPDPTLALNQLVAGLVIVVMATALRVAWLPRERAAGFGAVSGVLGASATAAFMLATQSGLLTVTAVLASLYPAVTVLLAATVLREHVHRSQAVGLVLCGVAVTLVAGG